MFKLCKLFIKRIQLRVEFKKKYENNLSINQLKKDEYADNKQPNRQTTLNAESIKEKNAEL